MTTESNKILSFNSLKIGYVSGRTESVLLPPLTASAGSGELIAVIGRNGIGKSTLLRTLTGIQKPLGGEIFFSDKSITDYSKMDLARKVGYISTEVVKASNMSVYDLVALGRFPYTNWIGKIEKEDHLAIMDALKKTSMESFSARFIAELSDGERQKAMIARILAQDTGIMIMDEPTAFLDIAGKYEIFHLLDMFSAKSDKTIIFSTHDLQMALVHSDKIWLITGNELAEGSPEDLMISGAFDHLFDSSVVRFNSYDGTFSYRSSPKGKIFVEGCGDKRHWTEKAINRAGYRISREKTMPFVRVPSETSSDWQLVFDVDKKEFHTLYELITFIKRGIVIPS
jgi:iron complex transport system ATP-binding protein